MNELEIIRSRIYEIRGQKVMLDRDLAALYGVETRRLNEQVKRNIERFPEDFMFQLTKGEMDIWKSQNATSNAIKMGMRKLPYAFTELGVAMLSSVLNSPLAIQTNINIMRAFVSFRRVVSLVKKEDLLEVKREIIAYIDDILEDQNDINELNRAHLDVIDQTLAELQTEQFVRKKRRPIGFVVPKEDQ
ncbi:MAG: ORF6N domain-containing protein [Prevotella sp.]|nr:ORF6N domain-containing protein [Prevotella sp.]